MNRTNFEQFFLDSIKHSSLQIADVNNKLFGKYFKQYHYYIFQIGSISVQMIPITQSSKLVNNKYREIWLLVWLLEYSSTMACC